MMRRCAVLILSLALAAGCGGEPAVQVAGGDAASPATNTPPPPSDASSASSDGLTDATDKPETEAGTGRAVTPASPAAGDGAASTAASPAAAPAAAPQPARSGTGPAPAESRLPEPARYTYATSGGSRVGEGSERPFNNKSTLTISGGSSQQWSREIRDARGDGTLTTEAVALSQDRLMLSGITLDSRVSGFQDMRRLTTAPTEVVRLPFVVGASATCSLDGDDVQLKLVAKVAERTRLAVQGEEVPVSLVELDLTFTGALRGTASIRRWFRESDLLLVRERQSSDITKGTVRVRSHSSSELSS
jgi:hypothetical protein